jgi:hypothetical protein
MCIYVDNGDNSNDDSGIANNDNSKYLYPRNPLNTINLPVPMVRN